LPFIFLFSWALEESEFPVLENSDGEGYRVLLELGQRWVALTKGAVPRGLPGGGCYLNLA
jgi:hypothetical protein